MISVFFARYHGFDKSEFRKVLSMYLHFDNFVLMKEKPNNRNLINGYR